MKEMIAELNEEALFANGFEDCLLGYVERFGIAPIALYDRAAVISKMVKRDGMDRAEAEEFFDFNIIGAWVGDGTPAYATILKRFKK